MLHHLSLKLTHWLLIASMLAQSLPAAMFVIPAEAGIHLPRMDSRLRGNDSLSAC